MQDSVATMRLDSCTAPLLTVAYDANGNTLTDAQGRSFTWDFENRLTQAVVPGTNGGTTTFKYDPFGRRIQKSGPLGTTNYLYDGFNSIEELDGSGNILAKYSQGLDTDEPLSMLRSGVTSYFQTDDLRSTTSLSSAAGALAKSYTYDAFGNLTASTGTLTNPFQFTSREFDSETGLNFYRARYYDSTIGRFISEDPIRFDGGFDFYVYVENNPALYIDPMGLVQYNKKPPDTVPVTGATAAALNCLEHCLQCLANRPNLNLIVSGGAEQTGHSKNSFHYKGLAVDISYWNNLQTSDVFRCAENCGFGAGGDEPKKHHWHLQLYPGNGSRALPLVYAPVPDQCQNCGKGAPPTP
jgi:RHS repeat-associated protein